MASPSISEPNCAQALYGIDESSCENICEIVGAVVSMIKSGIVSEAVLPAASVTVTVFPVYVPSANELNVIVFDPTTDVVELLNPNVELIVPIVSELNT